MEPLAGEQWGRMELLAGELEPVRIWMGQSCSLSGVDSRTANTSVGGLQPWLLHL